MDLARIRMVWCGVAWVLVDKRRDGWRYWRTSWITWNDWRLEGRFDADRDLGLRPL